MPRSRRLTIAQRHCDIHHYTRQFTEPVDPDHHVRYRVASNAVDFRHVGEILANRDDDDVCARHAQLGRLAECVLRVDVRVTV